MFYSNEILTRRKGPLGVIWIAATLGSKSSLKKLSKKDVNGVNLVSACEYIAKPPEPMALRLTSNLMVGVTRVYNAQYGFYLNEVNNTFLRLKQNLSKLNFEADVTMPATEARYETITMEDDPNFELPGTTLQSATVGADTSFTGLPPLAVDFGWVRPLDRAKATGSESAVDSASASYAASYSFDDPFISAPADHRSASISLQMPPPASSGSMSFLGGPAADFGGLNLGVDEELGWGDGQNLFDIEGNAAPITGGNQGSAHANQNTTGIGDDILDRDHAEIVRGDHGWRPDARKGTTKRNIGRRLDDQSREREEEESVVPDTRFEGHDFHDMEMDYMEAGPDFPANLTTVPGTDVMHEQDLHVLDKGGDVTTNEARKPRVPKPGRFVDASTQLLPLEMARLREGRLSDEEVSSRRSEREEIQKEKQSVLNAIVGRLSDDIVAPELHDLWDAIVGQKRVLGEQGRQGSGSRSKKAKVNENELTEAVVPGDHVAHLDADEGYIGADMYPDENPMDNGQWDAGNASHDTPNKSRAVDTHSNPSIETEMLRGGNDSYSFTGPVSVENVRRNRTLKPWNMMDQTDAASSVAASGGSKSKVTPLGANLKGEFKPESGRSRRASSIGGSGSLLFGLSPGPSGYASDIGPQEFTFDGPTDGEMDTEGSHVPFQDSQIRVAAMEKETGDFYDYAQSLVNQAGVDYVYFSELLPGDHSTREAAASAFYHVLVLSTRSMIRPVQTDPYSDIKIELV